jgi:cytochrome c
MRAKMKFYFIAVPAMFVLATSSVVASDDLELGRYLAAECLTCHRNAGASATIPNIAGLDRDHIAAVLRAYRAQELPNPVMRAVASRLKDDEINALAAYLSTAKRP